MTSQMWSDYKGNSKKGKNVLCYGNVITLVEVSCTH